jgi:hypothetical protein
MFHACTYGTTPRPYNESATEFGAAFHFDGGAELRIRVVVARTLALRHLESARERQKKAFDSSHRLPTLRPGDLVMLRVEGHRPKLDARYTGPYTVRTESGDENVNVDYLKL